MDDYISRQAAMDCMMDCQHDFRDGCVWIPRHEAVTRLEKTQSADVVEVVRCKYCKFYQCYKCSRFRCPVWVADDDYCSYGERKDE